MRVAVLADIHGNLPALDAVLASVDAAGAHWALLGPDVTLRCTGYDAQAAARVMRAAAPRYPAPSASQESSIKDCWTRCGTWRWP